MSVGVSYTDADSGEMICRFDTARKARTAPEVAIFGAQAAARCAAVVRYMVERLVPVSE